VVDGGWRAAIVERAAGGAKEEEEKGKIKNKNNSLKVLRVLSPRYKVMCRAAMCLISCLTNIRPILTKYRVSQRLSGMTCKEENKFANKRCPSRRFN
jgi:hypothetical protein